MSTYNPTFIQIHQAQTADTATELDVGLRQSAASVAPKFFYDELGSRLFNAITELSEYYPTRTEASIFARHGADMARHVPAQSVMIDLGAGCCTKAARLFPVFQPQAYVAVDISVEFLRNTLHALAQQHDALPMLGLGMDFSNTLSWPTQAQDWLTAQQAERQGRLLFYPGSSIGNFAPDEALSLLRQAHALCQQGGPDGGLLIGVDRAKAVAVLQAAYDDSLGVTAAFNRNVLSHANRILGSDFNPRLWEHVAFFNSVESRIEMHLESRQRQMVRWPGGERTFEAGERIHTENSYKWTPEAFADLLQQAGFHPSGVWSDEQNWFSIVWAKVSS
ncbi:MAG: L-histidine N(alpha)-methyltransferase [Alphaproteobacteria bacterium]|nr:L-histidine N(alpha)-methyltransferase [Alphaproteobacteria bacterium]